MSGQKTVWVTGASSGLGLYTAIQLQKDGWRVIAGARSFEEGEKDGMYRLKLDVTDEDSIRRFCDKAAEIALPDALVQCAGMLVLGSCEETGTEEFRRVIDSADLVIAKGQGNFESLETDCKRPVFFLFRAKCRTICSYLGGAEINSLQIIGRNL